jgi:hypothetical protein
MAWRPTPDRGRLSQGTRRWLRKASTRKQFAARRDPGTALASRKAVTVRISVAGDDHGTRRIRVEGRLSHGEIDELEQVVGDDPGVVVLDLTHLRSADSAGVGALRRLRAKGVRMCGTSPQLAWQIEEEQA